MKRLLILGLLASGLASMAKAQTCDCPSIPEISRGEPGILWRGSTPIGLEEMAHIAAPALWFSLDEPLLWTTETRSIPNPHPCDPAGEPAPTEEGHGRSGVVYYQPSVIKLRPDAEPVTWPEDDPQFFEKVDSFIIKYYFYYIQDFGTGGHAHDVEVAAFALVPEKTPEGCYQLRLQQVTAYAHGVDWYNNIMEARRDMRWPVALFVEEGKHASCPDRNNDGIYTPGYDVTKHVNDAWGVRDVLGQDVLQGASFKASMTKARIADLRMRPPEVPGLCPTLPSDAARKEEYLGRYELRPAHSISICDEVTEGKDHLASMMKTHGFGTEHQPTQYGASKLRDVAQEIKGPASIVPSVSLRRDAGPHLGLSFLLKGLDGGEFWLVPKFNFMFRDRYSAEGLITPSASRWVDWYLTLGAEYLREKTEEVDGATVVTRDDDFDWAIEWGWKFRFRAPSKIRPFLLGYHFGGLRVGIRANGFDGLNSPRITAELGAGVW